MNTWDTVKYQPYDISGIKNPELWYYDKINNIFYPVILITDIK